GTPRTEPVAVALAGGFGDERPRTGFLDAGRQLLPEASREDACHRRVLVCVSWQVKRGRKVREQGPQAPQLADDDRGAAQGDRDDGSRHDVDHRSAPAGSGAGAHRTPACDGLIDRVLRGLDRRPVEVPGTERIASCAHRTPQRSAGIRRTAASATVDGRNAGASGPGWRYARGSRTHASTRLKPAAARSRGLWIPVRAEGPTAREGEAADRDAAGREADRGLHR